MPLWKASISSTSWLVTVGGGSENENPSKRIPPYSDPFRIPQKTFSSVAEMRKKVSCFLRVSLLTCLPAGWFEAPGKTIRATFLSPPLHCEIGKASRAKGKRLNGKAEVGSEIQVLLFAIIEGLFSQPVLWGCLLEKDEMMLITGGLRLGFYGY